MKVGDLLCYTGPGASAERYLALVIGKSRLIYFVEVVELTGLFRGKCSSVHISEWEVISEGSVEAA